MFPKSFYTTLTLALAVMTCTVSAQDIITLRNNRQVTGYVTEVAPQTLTYQKNKGDTRVYKLDIADVKMVEYENGEKEEFEGKPASYQRGDGTTLDRRRGRDVKSHEGHTAYDPEQYKNNALRFYPLHLNNHGFGLALEYERVLDKKGFFSFELPISYSMWVPGVVPEEQPRVWGMYPTFKFYPTTTKGPIKYAMGLSLAYEKGHKKIAEWDYDPWTGVSQYVVGKRDVERLGVMIVNGFTATPTPHVSLGLEMGLGALFSADNWYEVNRDYSIPIVRFGFRVGYNF